MLPLITKFLSVNLYINTLFLIPVQLVVCSVCLCVLLLRVLFLVPAQRWGTCVRGTGRRWALCLIYGTLETLSLTTFALYGVPVLRDKKEIIFSLWSDNAINKVGADHCGQPLPNRVVDVVAYLIVRRVGTAGVSISL